MAIPIKTPEDIEKMRVAGRLAAEVLEMIEAHIKPGVSTGELDRLCKLSLPVSAITASRNPSASPLTKWYATVFRTTKSV